MLQGHTCNPYSSSITCKPKKKNEDDEDQICVLKQDEHSTSVMEIESVEEEESDRSWNRCCDTVIISVLILGENCCSLSEQKTTLNITYFKLC